MESEHEEHGPWISGRARSVAISAIKKMAMLSAKVPDAASLAWGLPSFRTPEPIRQAVAERLRSDPAIGMYALPDGLPELREAVAREHLAETGIAIDPEENVIISSGNMEGVHCLLQAILDPGDEVIVTDPGFVSHIAQIQLHGGKPVFWKLNEATGWTLDMAVLPRLATPRTKAILLVTPSNPTGVISSLDWFPSPAPEEDSCAH